MAGNAAIEYLRVYVSAGRHIKSAYGQFCKSAANVFLIYCSSVPRDYENCTVRLNYRLTAVAEPGYWIELQRLRGIYAEYLLVAGMLYKHIVATVISICGVNILYISAILLRPFRIRLEVVYETAGLIKTDKLSNPASYNALKLRSVKYLRNNTVAAPPHSLAYRGLDVKRRSVSIDNYQQRLRFGLLHKPRYVYARYSDRTYAFYIGMAAQIASIRRVYIFKDVRPENISVWRNGRNCNIVVVGDRQIRIRLNLQLDAVRLETPIAEIRLEISAAEDIRQLLARVGRIHAVYVGADLERRQSIPEQLVPITGSYDVYIFIVFFKARYIESRKPGNAGLA